MLHVQCTPEIEPGYPARTHRQELIQQAGQEGRFRLRFRGYMSGPRSLCSFSRLSILLRQDLPMLGQPLVAVQLQLHVTQQRSPISTFTLKNSAHFALHLIPGALPLLPSVPPSAYHQHYRSPVSYTRPYDINHHQRYLQCDSSAPSTTTPSPGKSSSCYCNNPIRRLRRCNQNPTKRQCCHSDLITGCNAPRPHASPSENIACNAPRPHAPTENTACNASRRDAPRATRGPRVQG